MPVKLTGLKTCTIAILTDIHYGNLSSLTQRRSDIADILLLRAVHRLNRYIKPDMVAVLGDILDDGNAPGASDRRRHIRSILDQLASYYIIIPGNHDGDVAEFYRDFTRPNPVEKMDGLYCLPFIDRDAPGHNATRSHSDIDRFRQVRGEWDGPIVALQHWCLHPAGYADIPYNYTNVEDIIRAMQQAGVILSLGGHYHNGAELIVEHGIHYVNSPGLCEYPFRFTTVDITQSSITQTIHQLALPDTFHMADNHVHTELAYCQKNMTVERAINFAEAIGLHQIGFAEHSGQLYFPSELYWGGECYRSGISRARPQDDRVNQYMALKRKFSQENTRFGLEVDIDFRGRLIVKRKHRRDMDFLLGSIHSMPHIKTPGVPESQLVGEFLMLLEKLLQHDVDAIAHPFRIFRRAQIATPVQLYEPAAALLHKYATAAEINFHTNEPPLQFITFCLEKGVKFSLGSDAHNLYEIGEFFPHLQLLKGAGYDGYYQDILLSL